MDPGDTVESVLALYDSIVAESRAITATVTSGDQPGFPPDVGLNARWVLLHMIEETARHAGHADLIRETIDGTTGP